MYYVKPGHGDEVARRLREMAAMVQQHEPDCLIYEAHRLQSNPDVFLLYELYRSPEALEAHRTTPHFQSIIEQRVVPLLERRERMTYDPVMVRVDA
jgi:quinol monooxygenase YgiN